MSNISHQTFIKEKSFNTVTSGAFRSSSCYFLKSHTYNYSVDGHRAIISPELGTWTIILGRIEYKIEDDDLPTSSPEQLQKIKAA